MAKLIEITGRALSGEWGMEDENGNEFRFLELPILPMKVRSIIVI